MKQILMYLLLLPLTYSISPSDSVSTSKENDGFTKVIGGIGFGRYMVCSDLVDYQDFGLSILKYEQNGVTYGGRLYMIRQQKRNNASITPAVNFNVGYSSEYFEILGGIGFPAFLNGTVRIGSENLNLNVQVFNDNTLFSGRGGISAGLGLTRYFEAGIGFGPPPGYYVSGILPINSLNDLRITFRLNPENYNEYSVSVSWIRFYF